MGKFGSVFASVVFFPPRCVRRLVIDRGGLGYYSNVIYFLLGQ